MGLFCWGDFSNDNHLLSDILLFKDSDFSIKELMFESGNISDLINILDSVMENPIETNINFKKSIKEKLIKYKFAFKKELNFTFNILAND